MTCFSTPRFFYTLVGTSLLFSAGHSLPSPNAKAHHDGIGATKARYLLRHRSEQSCEWLQVGQDLIGRNINDGFGAGVALSGDGSTLAVGASFRNTSDPGHVRVFSLLDVNATNPPKQLGADIFGEAPGDQAVSSALSRNGRILAIGARYNDGNGPRSGHVRVYEYNDYNWTQIGKDIDGENTNDWLGGSVALSADGSIVCAGATQNDGVNRLQSGHVRAYRYHHNDSQWIQMGGDIDGEAAGDISGNSVSLSADGFTVAIGAPWNDGPGGLVVSSGQVRVFEYNTTLRGWLQIGNDIDGEGQGDQSGWGDGLSLSADGRRVAIGAFAADGDDGVEYVGHVRVFERITDDQWIQLGRDIDGQARLDQAGISVELSADGKIVVMGASRHGADQGRVRAFAFRNETSDWVQVGKNVDGHADYESFGSNIALSEDGTVFVAAGTANVYGTIRTGFVRVYTIEPSCLLEGFAPSSSPTIPPTAAPTIGQTVASTIKPTTLPTLRPTLSPTLVNSNPATESSTISPTTLHPTASNNKDTDSLETERPISVVVEGNDGQKGLSMGVVAGISAASLVGGVLLALLIGRKRWRRRSNNSFIAVNATPVFSAGQQTQQQQQQAEAIPAFVLENNNYNAPSSVKSAHAIPPNADNDEKQPPERACLPTFKDQVFGPDAPGQERRLVVAAAGATHPTSDARVNATHDSCLPEFKDQVRSERPSPVQRRKPYPDAE